MTDVLNFSGPYSILVIQGFLLLIFSIAMSWSHFASKKPREYLMDIFAYLKFAERNLTPTELEKLELTIPVLTETEILTSREELKLYSAYGRDKAMLFSELQAIYYREKKTPFDLRSSLLKRAKRSIFLKTLYYIVFPITVFISIIFLFPILFWIIERQNNRKKDDIFFKHPAARASLCKSVIGATCIEVLILIVILILKETKKSLSFGEWLMIIYMTLSLMSNFFFFLKQIKNQIAWKKRWIGIFDFIMQKAMITDNFQQYNIAYNLAADVKQVPTLPISDLSKTYILIFTVSQFILSYAMSKGK